MKTEGTDSSLNQVKYAYVTFKRMDTKDMVLDAYTRNRSFYGLRNCCIDAHQQEELDHLFILDYFPKVAQACSPGNVIWENLGYNRCSRRVRSFINWVFAILLVVLNLVFTVVMMRKNAEYFEEYNLHVDCPSDEFANTQ